MVIKWNKSTCSFCGLGCGLEIGVEKAKIVKIRGLKGHPTNDGDLCLFPTNSPTLFTDKDRLKQPLIRREGKLEPSGWEEAIKYVSEGFKKIIREHGPESIAFYGGAMNLTEEYYLINKLMKGAIGTNNVDCSTRLCMASTAGGFISTFGADTPPTCYADVEKADLFFIAGCNMAISIPVMWRRILKAKKRNKAKIIVIDPRKTETSKGADIHLQIQPGTDVALNNALAYELLKQGFIDENSVESYTSGLNDLKKHVKKYSTSVVSEITGCSKKLIIKVAQIIGEAKAMMTFWFQGYNHSSQAVFKNNTLHNLSLLTGNICRPGAGPLSITGEANALGNRWVGALAHLLPGLRSISNSYHRQEVADLWGIHPENIGKIPGRSIIDIIKGLHSGDIRGLWVMTTNPAASLPYNAWVIKGLNKGELLVVQDIFFPTETTMLADVVLAAAQWCEKEGTFISSERRIELVEKFIDAPGNALPDHEIILKVARAMGFENMFQSNTPEEIFEEWKKFTFNRLCDMTGVTYQRLRGKVGLQLPCYSLSHPGTKRLYNDLKFPRIDGRAALLAREYIRPSDKISAKYPFILITGRIPFHFNSRTRTGRMPKLNNAAPSGFLNIHSQDASQFNISEKDEVIVTSSRGNVILPAIITDDTPIGTLFIPWHYGSALGIGEGKLANNLTTNIYDMHSKQPEFKYSTVNVRKK